MRWVVVNGERGPGVRSPKLYALDSGIKFGWVNWTTLILYLSLMLLMGFYFSRKEVSTDDYFLGGGRIPWWAAGISIYGTQLSAITFMAVPAIVYATDWRLAIGTVMILGIVPIIFRYYLPSFRKMHITTAYEFLETRFNFKVRVLGSATFIMLQLARMGVVLYLPAIAISSVTGINVILCIAAMGIFATIYTVMGGIEAVIWTDVVQVVILMGGAISCIFVALANIDGGVSEVIRIGSEYSKFKLIDWRFDYTQLVFWVAIIGFFFLNLISYTSDQVIIQRYLTVKSEKEAARSLWTNGIITLPGIFIFFGLGTTLFVYYLTNPAEISSNTPDEILPYFVVAELPMGVAGLVISGIFAASMSSVDSSMNSIATAYITDFHKHFWPNEPDKKYLVLAKYVTVLMGVFGTCTAIWIATANVGFIFDFFQEVLGMIGGSLGGVFALAVITKTANAKGVITGMVAGVLITIIFKNFTDVNGYLFGAIGVISCFVVGLVVSVFTQDKKLLS
ncbi:MAG: sodium:solute symporter [Saprospiraceae bacterium]|nr:sodium:solute symporter [Saprospiraceae bacterium]